MPVDTNSVAMILSNNWVRQFMKYLEPDPITKRILENPPLSTLFTEGLICRDTSTNAQIVVVSKQKFVEWPTDVLTDAAPYAIDAVSLLYRVHNP